MAKLPPTPNNSLHFIAIMIRGDHRFRVLIIEEFHSLEVSFFFSGGGSPGSRPEEDNRESEGSGAKKVIFTFMKINNKHFGASPLIFQRAKELRGVILAFYRKE